MSIGKSVPQPCVAGAQDIPSIVGGAHTFCADGLHAPSRLPRSTLDFTHSLLSLRRHTHGSEQSSVGPGPRLSSIEPPTVSLRGRTTASHPLSTSASSTTAAPSEREIPHAYPSFGATSHAMPKAARADPGLAAPDAALVSVNGQRKRA
jgi:hypothetical protein